MIENVFVSVCSTSHKYNAKRKHIWLEFLPAGLLGNKMLSNIDLCPMLFFNNLSAVVICSIGSRILTPSSLTNMTKSSEKDSQMCLNGAVDLNNKNGPKIFHHVNQFLHLKSQNTKYDTASNFLFSFHFIWAYMKS